MASDLELTMEAPVRDEGIDSSNLPGKAEGKASLSAAAILAGYAATTLDIPLFPDAKKWPNAALASGVVED
jgi:hypothetical protein